MIGALRFPVRVAISCGLLLGVFSPLGGQEPGSDSEIVTFCEKNFGVEFPLFSKLEVNGAGRDPLYAWLTAEESGPEAAGDIAWNFAKFLVGRDGALVARFAPPTEPCSEVVKQKIEEALG